MRWRAITSYLQHVISHLSELQWRFESLMYNTSATIRRYLVRSSRWDRMVVLVMHRCTELSGSYLFLHWRSRFFFSWKHIYVRLRHRAWDFIFIVVVVDRRWQKPVADGFTKPRRQKKSTLIIQTHNNSPPLGPNLSRPRSRLPK